MLEKGNKFEQKYTELKIEFENISKLNDQMKNEISSNSKVQIQKLETENEELLRRVKEVESLLKQKDEDLKNSQNMREKEDALKTQQITFLNMQLQEAKIAMDES